MPGDLAAKGSRRTATKGGKHGKSERIFLSARICGSFLYSEYATVYKSCISSGCSACDIRQYLCYDRQDQYG